MNPDETDSPDQNQSSALHRRSLLMGAGLGGAGVLGTLAATTGTAHAASSGNDGSIMAVWSVAGASQRDLSGVKMLLANRWGQSSPPSPAHYRRVAGDPGHGGAFQDSTGAWFAIAEEVLRPEMFGAIPVRNLTHPPDSTAALARWRSAVQATERPSVLAGLYRSAEPLTFDTGRLTLVGEDSMESGFVFDDCNGISLSQSNAYDSFLIENLVLITTTRNRRVGFRYRGASSYGDTAFRTLRLVTTIGLDRYRKHKRSGGGGAADMQHGWKYDFDVGQGNQLVCVSCRAEGAESDRLDGFPDYTVGFAATDSTQFQLQGCSAYFKQTGVRLRNQSESMFVTGGLYVANFKGIDIRSDQRPANGHVISGAHVSSYVYNINLGFSGSEITRLHKISDCLLFKRPDNPRNGFVHIKDDSQQSTISGVTFWHGGALDAVGSGDVAIVAGGHARFNQYSNCVFVNQARILKVNHDAKGVGLIAPSVDDSKPAQQQVRPVEDHGDDTFVALGSPGGRRWPS